MMKMKLVCYDDLEETRVFFDEEIAIKADIHIQQANKATSTTSLMCV